MSVCGASTRGSITVFSGSSIRMRICGISIGAPSLILRRGGILSITVPSVARVSDVEPTLKSYASRSVAITRPILGLPSATLLTSMHPGASFLRVPSSMYLFIVALIASIFSASPGLSRKISGSISLSVEGASPTISSTFSQYSGSDVNWSHATTAHLL